VLTPTAALIPLEYLLGQLSLPTFHRHIPGGCSAGTIRILLGSLGRCKVHFSHCHFSHNSSLTEVRVESACSTALLSHHGRDKPRRCSIASPTRAVSLLCSFMRFPVYQAAVYVYLGVF
jgi:hypothetical protein